ncbi:MAG: HNH endonuclease [Patescibacteria group bacterium]
MGKKSEARKTERVLALERDRYECQVCAYPYGLQVHHIIHRSKGGCDKVDNYITLCCDCHLIVHNKLKSLIPSGSDIGKFKHIILLVKRGV